jgi:methionine-rich copper-binding protein CopC
MKLRSSLLVSALIFIPILNSPAAHAHAALESTIPAKGAIVSTSTNRVSMLFGEDILVLTGKNPNAISVTNQRGTVVSTGVAVVSGMKIWQSLKTPLQAGRYTVKYRVVSADGHVVSGSYTFTVK